MAAPPHEIDPRLFKVEIEVLGTTRTYDQQFWIRARGVKYANAQMNECQVEISNLTAPVRNYILSETSPFNKNRTPKLLSVYVGRKSTGLSLVYSGNITISKPTQPPDVNLVLKCGTAHFMKGKVGSRFGGKEQSLKVIAGSVAKNMNLVLDNQATDKTVANYYHNGDAFDEVQNIKDIGVDAWVDDKHLVLKDVGLPLKGKVLNLNLETGMIGIPEVSEQGLKVRFLFDPAVRLGGAINITSKLNPSVNGLYVIYKLGFAFSSRETEFDYIAECLRAKT